MLCTDIRVSAEEADKAFMRAWNLLIGHGMRYAASFREMARDGKDELSGTEEGRWRDCWIEVESVSLIMG